MDEIWYLLLILVFVLIRLKIVFGFVSLLLRMVVDFLFFL